ncbi:MAG TPA: orotidine-5'-phosphate decarboxylase [Actinotalea sp.]|jgi:orotidine-5'-phosphate decarboxylase
MTGPSRFGMRLAAAMDRHGPLCVGIDPHPGLLVDWGLADDVEGLRTFCLTVLDAVVGHVAAIKPQSAFFERHGSAGIAVLEEVLRAARGQDGGTQVILDAKRGDIGSTMQGYADAYLREGAPLACDALTVSPFLGFGSLTPAVEAAERSGSGLFVLALTSNPEGAQVQHAVPPGPSGHGSVAGTIVSAAGALNARELDGAVGAQGPAGADGGIGGLGSIGLVVGATVGAAVRDLGLDLAAVRGPLLAPGVGAQGAGPEELGQVFGSARRAVLASSSRGVLASGPQVSALRAAARAAADDAARALGR